MASSDKNTDSEAVKRALRGIQKILNEEPRGRRLPRPCTSLDLEEAKRELRRIEAKEGGTSTA